MRVIEKDKLFEYIPKPKNDIESDYYCEIADTIVDLPEYIIDDEAADVQLENELSEAKRLLKLALEDIKRTDACFLCKYKDNYDTRCGVNEGCFVWRHADDIEKFLNNKRVKED